MQAWTRLDDGTDVTRDGFRYVTHKEFLTNKGLRMQADIVGKDGDDQAACVIAITKQNKVVIARQFRCGPELIMDELPGGIVDPGEDPEAAAKRELLEETGYGCESISYLGKAHLNAWDSLTHHYFFAIRCEQVVEPKPEQFEEIEVDEIPIARLFENAMNAKMSDPAAVLLAYDMLKKLDEKS